MLKKVFVLFFLANLVFLGLLNAQGDPKMIDEIVAVIGRETVLLSDVENQALQLRSQGYYTSGDLKCEVLEDMLYGKFLVNQARIDSVEVSDAEVNSELERRLNMFINQIGSEEKLEEFYGKSMPEIKSEFRDVIREQMIGQRMQQTITADLKVTPHEVKTFYKNLPKDSLPIINTQFTLEQIVVQPKIDEVEILRIKDKLREFKDRVSKGESFATLAVMYSEDPGSAAKGGELGFVSRGDLVPEFSAVAFNLDPGQVSKIVKTDYGYHIIQLIEKKGERINCRHILLRPRISVAERTTAKQKLDSVRTSIMKGEQTFKEACWRYSESEDTRLNGGVMVNQTTGDTKWEASQLKPKIANAIRNLKVGEISEPFESEDDKGNPVYEIILLKEKTDPHQANLEDDYQRIQDMTLSQKKSEFMDDYVRSKVKGTYIRIDDNFKNCKFRENIWKSE